MRTLPGPGRHDGFTLLEILIAIGLFAIAVSIVYSLYATMVSVAERVDDRTAQNDRVRLALDRVNHDLAGIHQGQSGYLLGRKPGDRTGEPFLEFLSTSHLVFNPHKPPKPLVLIRYYLDRQNEAVVLLRSEAAVLPGEDQDDYQHISEKTLVVSRDIEEIDLVFLHEGAEQDEWDSRDTTGRATQADQRFPAAIRLTVICNGTTTAQNAGDRYMTAVYVRPAQLDGGRQ